MCAVSILRRVGKLEGCILGFEQKDDGPLYCGIQAMKSRHVSQITRNNNAKSRTRVTLTVH